MTTQIPAQSETIDPDHRRPIRARRLRVFERLAGGLARKRVSPNSISVLSIGFAAASAIAMVAAAEFDGGVRLVLLLAAAAAVQLRLLCNLLDGMVAQQAGSASLSGKLYNEAPDRVSDILAFLGFGALGRSEHALFLAALAACMAVMTAYVRGLSAEVGAKPSFVGPMAKPQRMALLTVSLLALAVLPTPWTERWGGGLGLVETVLLVVIIGCLLTSLRRWRGVLRHCAHAGKGRGR